MKKDKEQANAETTIDESTIRKRKTRKERKINQSKSARKRNLVRRIRFHVKELKVSHVSSNELICRSGVGIIVIPIIRTIFC